MIKLGRKIQRMISLEMGGCINYKIEVIFLSQDYQGLKKCIKFWEMGYSHTLLMGG